MQSRLILSLSAALILIPPSVARADEVSIRSGRHPGFGRVMFDWPKAVNFTIEAGGRNAVVHFDRPIKADLGEAVDHLPAYVAAAAIGSDGRSVRFTLSDSFRTRPVRNGTSVGIDFLDSQAAASSSTPQPPAPKSPPAKAKPPAPAARKPAPQQTPSPANAPISVAEREDFTRIVFPWGDTKYKLEKRGREYVVVFERPLDPDLAVLRVDKPKGIVSASGKRAVSRFGLHLRLAAGYTPRAFTEDGKIVLDLVAAKSKQAPAPAKEPASTAAAAPAKEPAPKAASAPPAIAAPAAPPAAATSEQGPQRVTVEAADIGQGTRLTLAWPEAVPAAIFARGGRIWAVFNAEAKLDFSGTMLREFRGIGTAEQIPAQALTILRAPLKPGFSARVSGSTPSGGKGIEWTIDVVPDAEPGPSFVVTPEPYAIGGGRLRVDAPGAVGPFTIDDPDMGDRLTLVPMAAGLGLGKARRFVECAFLPTFQGMAIAPNADGLQVRVTTGQVTISAPGGMALSEPQAAPVIAQAAAPNPEAEPLHRAAAPARRSAGPAEWSDEPAADFAAKRAAFDLDQAKAGEADRARRRLATAELYLHNQLAAEALGELGLAAKDDPNFAATGAYHLARGQAELLMGRPADAVRDLGHPDLAADPDALMWRGRALSDTGQWTEAWQSFQAAQMATLDAYPPRMRAGFRIAAARAAMETGDLEAARKHLAALPEGLPKQVSAEAALVSGEIAERADDGQRAFSSYEQAASDGAEPVAARARLRKVVVGQKLGRIADPAAIEELERLRFAWRGDETERATIEALGQFYLGQNRYREAFAAFDDANRLFPNSPNAAALNSRMRGLFADLFLRGKADQMEPVKALSLFLDYRDLTPVGREGDEMIRKLADRLAAVDLLDQAETLLDYQIKNRLEGVAKAQIATKLAAMALLNHEPQRALQAIRETRMTALPEELNEKRRILEAQALMELGHTDDALELIARYSGPESDALRAEIYWRGRDWPDAARSMMALLAAKPSGAGLSPSDRQIVMKAAISYALAGDQSGLGTLRDRYRAGMAQSADAAAFDVLTGPIDVEGVKFRELAAKIAGLDSLQGFLKSYKESL